MKKAPLTELFLFYSKPIRISNSGKIHAAGLIPFDAVEVGKCFFNPDNQRFL